MSVVIGRQLGWGHFLPPPSPATSDRSWLVSGPSGIDELMTLYGTPKRRMRYLAIGRLGRVKLTPSHNPRTATLDASRRVVGSAGVGGEDSGRHRDTDMIDR
jgi:hypothetical protein